MKIAPVWHDDPEEFSHGQDERSRTGREWQMLQTCQDSPGLGRCLSVLSVAITSGGVLARYPNTRYLKTLKPQNLITGVIEPGTRGSRPRTQQWLRLPAAVGSSGRMPLPRCILGCEPLATRLLRAGNVEAQAALCTKNAMGAEHEFLTWKSR